MDFEHLGDAAVGYYVPAYIALIAASVGLISLPTQLASNREAGVLRRYRASGLPVSAILISQVVVTFVVTAISSLLLVAAAYPLHHIMDPDSIPLLLLGFLVVVATFSSLGILLGTLIPTARSAQATGVLVWFVMLMVGGAGPPPEVLDGAIATVGDLTPLRFAIEVTQDGWLGLDPGVSWLVCLTITLVATTLSFQFFGWD